MRIPETVAIIGAIGGLVIEASTVAAFGVGAVIAAIGTLALVLTPARGAGTQTVTDDSGVRDRPT